MGKGLQRVAATCGGLTVKANGKTVKYGANGKPSKRAVSVGSMKRLVRGLRCDFGSAPHALSEHCQNEAVFVTNTGYKCCPHHTPLFQGKIADDVKVL